MEDFRDRKDVKEQLLEELQRAARGLVAGTLAAQARYQNALHAWDRAARRGGGEAASNS